MKFATTCIVTAGKTNTINVPNLTTRGFIPEKVTFTEIKDGEEVPASGIMARIHAGNAEICNQGEPTFRICNEFDMSPFSGVVEKAGKISVTITNRTSEPKRLKVYTSYTSSYGSVLMEEKIDHFENVLNEIHARGYCTRLVVTFNKPVEIFEFASVAECLEGSWLEPFNVPLDDDLDIEDQIYTIDFTQPELGRHYIEHLNFMEIRVAPKKTDDKEPLYMYITAYGFPYGH